ncbi:MAG: TolC family protein [Phycisphaeraceae bacterium]|nr:TolC family protein [Phycisphaeraceae bacterium]
MMRNCLRLVICLMALAAAGCYESAMHRLDNRVTELIQREQNRRLGADVQNDPQPVPPNDHGKTSASKDYAESSSGPYPTTAQDAPAEPLASATQPTTAPATQEAATQPAERMNLEAVLACAIARAPEYRQQKETLFLSALGLLSQQHDWGPRFFSNVNTSFQTVPEAGDHDQALSVMQDVGVRQKLPYGGEVSVRALVNYVNQLRSEVGSAQETQSGAVEVSLSIPLLRGAGESAREPLVQARRNLVYAVRDFERFRRSFLVDIASDYFAILEQAVSLANTRHQVDSLNRQARRYEALAKAGRVAYFEVQRFQTEVLFALSNLQDQTEQYAAALDSFKLRLGMPVTESIELEPEDIPVEGLNLDALPLVRMALRSRLDLQNTEDRVEDARRQVRIARNGMLPDLDLTSTVSLPTDPSRKYGRFDLDPSSGQLTAGLSLALPVDRFGELIALRSANVSLEQAQRNFDQQQSQVSLEVRQAIRQVQRDQLNLSLQQRNVELAERREREVILKARELGPEELISATDALLSARNRLEQARRSFRQDALRLLLATEQMRVSSEGQWVQPAAMSDATTQPTTQPAEPPATAPATLPIADAVLEQGVTLESVPPIDLPSEPKP